MASLPFEWKLTEVLSYLLLCYLPCIDFVHGQYRLTPKNTIGVEGQSAMLHCAIRGSSGMVVWNHLVSGKPTLQLSIGGQVDVKLGVDRSRRIQVVGNRGRGEYHLRIHNVRMSDAGRYECMALVGFTRIVKRSAALKVVRPPEPGYPVCQMEPAFGLIPGMEVKFSCDTMGGQPKAQIRWWGGKKPLTTPKEGHDTYTHTLTAKDYGKRFFCQEITPAYKTPRTCEVTPLEIDLKVDLQPSPQIEVRPGDAITFSCYGQGTASFRYSWRLNDQALPIHKNIRRFGPNGSKLRISGITAANNKATVSCVLTNSHGFSTKATSVIAVIMPRPRPPRPRPKPKPTTKVQENTPFVPRVPGPYPDHKGPGFGPTLGPDATWAMDDYEVHFESELGADWGLDPPNGSMSSPAMTAMAAALVGILIGVIAAVALILTKKYMNSNESGNMGNMGNIRTFFNTTNSTSIPCSSLVGVDGSSEPSIRPDYDLPPRDYPRRNRYGRNSDPISDRESYLDLRPESMISRTSTYQGLNSSPSPRPRSSTYHPDSYYSEEYEVGSDADAYSPEYYEDVLNQDPTRDSRYHYRFSPPVDPSEIQVRCMSADRATRHFFAR